MRKQTLAIVSSYDELCGNASYTKALVDELSKRYDVTIIPLNGDLLRRGQARIGKKYILGVCKQLKTFDCVNIQFESGLFGVKGRHILSRFLLLGKSCKRLVLTMHRYSYAEKYFSLKRIATGALLLRFGPIINHIKYVYGSNRFLWVYNRIIQFCKRRNHPIIVHTQRECELIKIKFGYDQVYDHPLCFYNQNYIQKLKSESSRSSFYKKLGLSEEKVYIGIFGFVNRYKNHETVIKALKFLPPQYELIIFGSQHPHSVSLEEKIDPYIKRLLDLILENKALGKRVKFYGSLNDEDFLSALIWCDFNVIPYLEVNQGGSAIAALSLEVGAKTIFSQNRAFLELAKYAPNCFKMFTIGNYFELAQSILTYAQDNYTLQLENFWSKYNATTNSQLYRRLLSGEEELELQENHQLVEMGV